MSRLCILNTRFTEAFSIIVNAIYFKAQWDYKFNPSYTSEMDFYSSEENSRKIQFMTDSEVRRLYAEDDEMQVLSLQYKDTSYAFNIFLPKKKFAFGEARQNMNAAKVQKLLSKLKTTYITLTIPKMKIETDYKLKDALIKMGVTDMFTDQADFSAMAKVPGLRVSDAAHKALIEVTYQHPKL
ncbi:serine proteinase inhibitor, partial [Oesophagostomum dentatum]